VSEDQLTTEEKDIIDILAEQGAEVDDIDDDDYEAGELPDDAEALKSLLLKEREIKSKRNKSLRKKDQAVHRMQDELKSMQEMIEDLRNGQNQSPDVEAKRREQEEVLGQWRDSVADKPENAIDYTNQRISQMESGIASMFAQLQESFTSELAGIKGEMNPEKVKYRDKINQLKANSKFAGLGDDVLLTIVQGMSDIKVPRGNVGGKAVEPQKSTEKQYEELRERARKLIQG
jgi:myosin heavy subunit